MLDRWMELKMQGCCGEQQGEDGETWPLVLARSPIPTRAAMGSAGSGFIRCLALVCIHGKKKTQPCSALSSLDQSRWLRRSPEHALASVHGTWAAVSATSSLLAWLSFASRSGLKTCFVQHCLIPAPANLENPPARTRTQETGWERCQNPPRQKGPKGDGEGRRCPWLKVRQWRRWKRSIEGR